MHDAKQSIRWAAWLLLLVHAALAISSLWHKSISYDEVTHLPAGLAIAESGEIRLNRQHPPLVKILAGLAAQATSPTIPIDDVSYVQGKEWDFGRVVLFERGNDHWALLRAGRLPIVALSVLGAWLVFVWSRRRFGERPALAALVLYVFCPTLLAHARFVTMDVAVGTLGLLSLYLAWLRARALSPTLWHSAAIGAAMGLTWATKFSGLVFVPALALLAVLDRGPRDFFKSWRGHLLDWSLRLSVALVVLWACYLFQGHPLAYFRDIGRLYADLEAGYVFFLAGEFSNRFPHYFFATTLLKSTLVELAAIVGVGVLLWRRREHWRDDMYLVVPAALFFVATSVMATNQGHRYLAPLYPMLFVLTAGVFSWVFSHSERLGRWVVVLLAAQALEAGLQHSKDYISYFNPPALALRPAPFWLDDSNVDWNQDIARLPAWLAEHDIESVRLVHFGHTIPAFYGVKTEPFLASDWQIAPRPGAYVLSSHVLTRGLLYKKQFGYNSDWLLRYRPIDVLGGSMYLYVFPESAIEGQDQGAAGNGQGAEQPAAP